MSYVWKGIDNVYTAHYSIKMDITWDKEKNHWLQANRAISFEEIASKILDKEYIDILENPARDNQMVFLMNIHGYTWVVPFLIDESERIVLKTAFPSRKFHKRYGEGYEQADD